MRRSFALALLVAFAAGCQKQPTASPASTTAPSTNPQPAPAAGQPAPPDAQAAKPPDLTALTLSLHHWIAHHLRHPASFEEFAAGADIKIPPPPPGKKYAISKSMDVILVNQ